jgi:hypothetical protein
MRRFPLAAALYAACALLAACGPNPRELEPGLKDALRDLAKATVANDQDRIIKYFFPDSGLINDPVGAKETNTPEGREKANESNRRWIRRLFKDSGIEKEVDVDRFCQALKYDIQPPNASVFFEIAAEGRRQAEVVTIRMTRTPEGWRVFQYERELKSMR